MTEERTQDELGVLHGEHLLLGGRFDEDATLLAPVGYGDPQQEGEAFAEGCALADLSGMCALLVSGTGASAFVSAACAGPALQVGECAFGAVLTGDGSIASVPLVARTGDEEFLVWDLSERAPLLEQWLGFLVRIEQDGYAPYAGVSVEDVSESLVPLLLWGPQAQAVLADYVASADALPSEGHVANVALDRIECLMARPAVASEPCHLLLVPPAAACVLWRSFLSFPIVSPTGTNALGKELAQALPWASLVSSTERVTPTRSQLVGWCLCRTDGTFVGARGLAE